MSIDATSSDAGATAQARIGTSQCSSNAQVEVQTFDQAGDPAAEPFNFIVN